MQRITCLQGRCDLCSIVEKHGSVQLTDFAKPSDSLDLFRF